MVRLNIGNKELFCIGILWIVLLFLSDFIVNKIIFIVQGEVSFYYYRPSVYIKLIIYLISSALLLKVKVSKKVIVLFVILFLNVLAGHYIYWYNGFNIDVLSTLRLYIRYTFPIVLYFLYEYLFRELKYQRIISKIISIIFLVNLIVVVTGFVFKIDFFRTYGMVRFGYSGLLPIKGANDATIFYFLSLVFFSMRYVYSRKITLGLILSIFSIVLIGTKALIGAGLIWVLLFLSYVVKNKKILFLSLFLSVLLVIVIVFSFYNLAFWKDYINDVGVVNAIFSGRLDFIKEKMIENIQQWNIVNFFFGGTDINKFDIEMDIINVFLFYGIIGAVAYFWLLFISIFKLNYNVPFNIMAIIFYLSIGALVGRVYYSSINAIYFAIVFLNLKYLNIHKFDTGNNLRMVNAVRV